MVGEPIADNFTPQIDTEPQTQPKIESKVPERNPNLLRLGKGGKFEKQLSVILEAGPSDKQIDAVAKKFEADDPTLPGARESAENVFSHLKELKGQEATLKAKYDKARRDAWGGKTPEERAQGRETYQQLREQIRDLSSEINDGGALLREADVKLEPDQVALTLPEKARNAVGKVGEGVVGVAGAGKKAVETGYERSIKAGAEAVKSGLELGRKGIHGIVEAGVATFKAAGNAESTAWSGVVSAVKSSGEKTVLAGQGAKTGIGRFFGGIGRGIGGAAEKAGTTIAKPFRAADVWAGTLRKSVGEQYNYVKKTAGEAIGEIKTEVGTAIIEDFNKAMTELGKAAAEKAGEIAGSRVFKFAEAQEKRVEGAVKQVGERLSRETKEAVDKGGKLLESAKQSVEKDRTEIRGKTDLIGDRLGFIAEIFSDVASPVIDGALDKGRGLRDGVLGFTRRKIEGIQIFGRKEAHLDDELGGVEQVSEQTENPAWSFLKERWQDLRLRSNESRKNLNAFIDKTKGTAGARFNPLKESVKARMERVRQILPGARVEDGKVVKEDGTEATSEEAGFFQKRGQAAKEFLGRSKDVLAQGMENIRAYVNVYAVSRWKEMFKSSENPDKEVQSRLKLLRGIGGESFWRRVDDVKKKAELAAGRGASLGIAGTLEGLRMVNTPRGRLVLGATGLALYAITNHDAISNYLQNSGIDVSSIFGGGSSPDAVANVGVQHLGGHEVFDAGGVGDISGISSPVEGARMAGFGDHEVLSDAGVSSGGGGGIPGNTETAAAQPSTGVEHQSNFPLSEESPGQTGVQSGSAGGEATAPYIPTSEITTIPDVIMSQIRIGQPVAEQARQLATQIPGNPEDNYLKILQKVLETGRDNFLSTAQAIINGEGGPYTPEQLQIAQEQLDSFAIIDKDPSKLNDLNVLGRLMHFWRPV